MDNSIRTIVLVAMVLLTIVSMWTTYVSLKESILPEPTVNIPLSDERVWDCSVFALALSVAIGLMLFALKMAIVSEQKRLDVLGLVGLTIIASISISFNMDVLYRTADKKFFLRYSTNRVRQVYEEYLAEAESALLEKRSEIRRDVAKQQGELQAEIEGLREAPEGYGPLAKKEDYELTLLEKTALVDLEGIEEALTLAEKADTLLASAPTPEDIDDVQNLQGRLRVAIRDVGAAAGMPLPRPVELESPLFTVFRKIFDFRDIGPKEVFFLLLAMLLDLGDIVGYSLVPNRPRKLREVQARLASGTDDFTGPEFVPPKSIEGNEDSAMPQLQWDPEDEPGEPDISGEDPGDATNRQRASGGRRSIRLRRR